MRLPVFWFKCSCIALDTFVVCLYALVFVCVCEPNSPAFGIFIGFLGWAQILVAFGAAEGEPIDFTNGICSSAHSTHLTNQKQF